MRVALVQLSVSDDPVTNLPDTLRFIEEAAGAGADLILTPEVTNCVSSSRTRQAEVLRPEASDPTLSAIRDVSRRHGAWVLIGSLALTGGADGRYLNRSFLVDREGEIRARYDKIHMFDVTLSETESYRESDGYQPGSQAVTHAIDTVTLGLTVCYDIRFPALYRRLAQAGAGILTVPAAFTVPTGRAHWETLLRARAIENGAFVLAPAQCGTHSVVGGMPRASYGHSLAVDPWGRILADGGDMPGVTLVDLDLSAVEDARRRIPSLTHDRVFEGP